ncbi:nitroreductase family protein [Xylaria digitata]|nr:nitroreductase family protein [Xylaria digitata]
MVSNTNASQFLKAAAYRRTCYALTKTSRVSNERIVEIVKEVLLFVPSSYNMQSARLSVVLGKKHEAMWDAIIEAAAPIFKGANTWDVMKPILEGSKKSSGSVLFFESETTINASKETHKSAAHMFTELSDHASGMHQILVWTALELEGLGANLQHLNAIPFVEAIIKNYSGFSPDEVALFKLKAHLNFGDEVDTHPTIPAKLPLNETFRVVK